MIDVNGNEFRTLSDPIRVDDKRVLRVFANDEQVYPEMNNPKIIKIRGSRTIHASHSHSGELASAVFGVGNISNLNNVLPNVSPRDFNFAGSVSFDITVSFCAVLKSERDDMLLSANSNGTYYTRESRDEALHIAPVRFSGNSLISRINKYNQTGDWDTGGSGLNGYSPINEDWYKARLCPLYGVSPVLCEKYISSTSWHGAPFEDSNSGVIENETSIIDADILVSIQMTTPQACSPVIVGYIEKTSGSNREAWGKLFQSKTSFPEYSANNGIHRVHAIINANPRNYNNSNISNTFPFNMQRFYKDEDFKPYHNSQPAIGNGYITCGFPTFADNGPKIAYLRIAGTAPDVSLSCEFSDWASTYDFTEDRSKLHSGEVYGGSTLCEVPIGDFLYVGKYNDATPEQREPQLSDLT